MSLPAPKAEESADVAPEGEERDEGEERAARTRRRLRYGALLLLLLAALGLWRSLARIPKERAIEISIAPEARAERVALTWLEDGQVLRHSEFNYDGRFVRRKIQLTIQLPKGRVRLRSSVVSAAGERSSERWIDIEDETVPRIELP